ncbi:MAG: alanine racemase, partial [Nitrospinales bacterium]
MEHHRATRAEINLEAFRHNLRFLRSVAGSSTKIMAVVKADAYGHGAVPCAQAAVEAGADYLGVGLV